MATDEAVRARKKVNCLIIFGGGGGVLLLLETIIFMCGDTKLVFSRKRSNIFRFPRVGSTSKTIGSFGEN